jgi:4'-phosphopantetheinyl transferase
MQLSTNEIHVWSTNLTTLSAKEQAEKIAFLSPDETERVARFRFPIHKQRFIAFRYLLRQILSLYVKTLPQEIQFAYTPYKKPYLLNPSHSPFQFNLAHSDDMAIYAITLNYDVGIDIEKMRPTYNQLVAQRFFNEKENHLLMQLPTKEKMAGFYRVWSRKEALIKAVGKGLSLPLSSFCVATQDVDETIVLENDTWSLHPLSIKPGYQAALATNQIIKSISHWQFIDHTYQLKEKWFPK